MRILALARQDASACKSDIGDALSATQRLSEYALSDSLEVAQRSSALQRVIEIVRNNRGQMGIPLHSLLAQLRGESTPPREPSSSPDSELAAIFRDMSNRAEAAAADAEGGGCDSSPSAATPSPWSFTDDELDALAAAVSATSTPINVPTTDCSLPSGGGGLAGGAQRVRVALTAAAADHAEETAQEATPSSADKPHVDVLDGSEARLLDIHDGIDSLVENLCVEVRTWRGEFAALKEWWRGAQRDAIDDAGQQRSEVHSLSRFLVTLAAAMDASEAEREELLRRLAQLQAELDAQRGVTVKAEAAQRATAQAAAEASAKAGEATESAVARATELEEELAAALAEKRAAEEQFQEMAFDLEDAYADGDRAAKEAADAELRLARIRADLEGERASKLLVDEQCRAASASLAQCRAELEAARTTGAGLATALKTERSARELSSAEASDLSRRLRAAEEELGAVRAAAARECKAARRDAERAARSRISAAHEDLIAHADAIFNCAMPAMTPSPSPAAAKARARVSLALTAEGDASLASEGEDAAVTLSPADAKSRSPPSLAAPGFSDAFTADANEAALFFAIEAEQDGGDGDDISH